MRMELKADRLRGSVIAPSSTPVIRQQQQQQKKTSSPSPTTRGNNNNKQHKSDNEKSPSPAATTSQTPPSTIITQPSPASSSTSTPTPPLLPPPLTESMMTKDDELSLASEKCTEVTISHCDSPNGNSTGSGSGSAGSRSGSEVDAEIQEINDSLNISINMEMIDGKSNDSLSGNSATSSNIGMNGQLLNISITNGGNDSATASSGGSSTASGGGMITNVAQIKKRISSSRTPTRKAKRIKFYRNGDRFYPGITIPVSNERYRSFESLFEDLTRLLEENVKIPGAVRTIYTMCGKKISTLDELEDGQAYICSCNNESFKKIEYNTSSQPLGNISNRSNQKVHKGNRPSSPLKNGGATGAGTIGSPVLLSRSNERDSVVYPRIVTLIRNGTKPRKIMRLLLNKRNSPSFDHVLTAITQKVKLDTGYVRKVFTLSGIPVQQLRDFFDNDDVFFAYGTERVNNPDDFKLEADEQKAINAIRKPIGTTGTTCKGPKPKMPVKSAKSRRKPTAVEDKMEEVMEESTLLSDSGIDPTELPAVIRDRYILGQIIGDGNFAIVLKVRDRVDGRFYALKIIDKSKCRGKEHYIDAEIRVMKKLQHPCIISLFQEVDQEENMFLILDFVSGGDLFDAITRVTRFSESQSRIMIRHLASAMAYLHSLSIVHRDIKPENLLVEMDEHGNVHQLKLADFGLACEVIEPLFAVCGTPTYVAPEILMETGYGLKIDVWAAGIILYILLCGFPPFVAPDNQQEPLFDAIISGVYEFPDPYWSDIGDGVRDLIANMLQSDPDVRFTSEDILDHYWTMDDGSNSIEYSS